MNPYPRRPASHVIGDEALRLLQAAFAPDWVISSVSPDYGIDLRLELVSDGRVTGEECYVQVKGTTKNHGRPTVRIRRETVQYWLGKLNPVLVTLIHVDSGEVWYGWMDWRLRGQVQQSSKKALPLTLPYQNSVVPLRETLPTYLHQYFARFRDDVASPTRAALVRMLCHTDKLHRECLLLAWFLQRGTASLTPEEFMNNHKAFCAHFSLHHSALYIAWRDYLHIVGNGSPAVSAIESLLLTYDQLRLSYIHFRRGGTEIQQSAAPLGLSPTMAASLLAQGWEYGEVTLSYEAIVNLLPTVDVLSEIKDVLFQLSIIGSTVGGSDTAPRA
jgi:hypothetical protein